jgi:hypothetical protein
MEQMFEILVFSFDWLAYRFCSAAMTLGIYKLHARLEHIKNHDRQLLLQKK